MFRIPHKVVELHPGGGERETAELVKRLVKDG